MKIFIDSELRCHVNNPDGIFREVDHPFFDNKCKTFIEGYRYDPNSEMIIPWKPYSELEVAQRRYEKQLLAEYAKALKTVGVSL